MYQHDVPIIAAAMRQSSDVFARGVMFAVLSARVQFPRMPAQCRELNKRKELASCLWGWKFGAYAYVQGKRCELMGQMLDAKTLDNALWSITRVPGIGIAKGAFVLQLMGLDIACLDSRNIREDGLSPRMYQSNGDEHKATNAYRRAIGRYVEHMGGKAQAYWDRWCIGVAASYDMTPAEVSRMHTISIVPRSMRNMGIGVPIHLIAEVPF